MTKRRRSTAKSPPVATTPESRGWLSILLHVVVFAIGAVVCGIFSVKMGQDNNWDLQNYHAYNAWAFLHDRVGYDVALAQRQTYLNPIADLPFYLGSTHLAPRTFGFLMGAFHGLAVGVIFGICFAAFRKHGWRFRVGLSLLCAGLGAYGPVFVGELGASQNDNLVGLVVLLSLWVFISAVATHGRLSVAASRRSLIAASVIMGAAVGLKLTMMIHVLGLIAGVLVIERNRRDRGRVLAVGSIALVAGILLTNGYWMAHMWHQFGNPFFPFYNNIFRSDWAEIRSFADVSMVPRNPLVAILVPYIIAHDNPYTFDQGGLRDARYVALYLLVVTMLVFMVRARIMRRRAGQRESRLSAQDRFLLVFFVVSFVVWEVQFCIVRYTICMEATAPLLIVIVALALWRNHVVRAVLIAAAFAATGYLMRPVHAQRLNWGKTFWRVRVPAVVDPQNTIVIIANSRPLAYLAPHFPPGIRWIGLKNNLTDPRRHSEMQEFIQEILAKHRGDVYLLTRAVPDAWLKHDVYILKYYNLEPVADSGQPVASLHSPGGLQLWRLQRQPEEPATPTQ